jgi:hypothetical protein
VDNFTENVDNRKRADCGKPQKKNVGTWSQKHKREEKIMGNTGKDNKNLAGDGKNLTQDGQSTGEIRGEFIGDGEMPAEKKRGFRVTNRGFCIAMAGVGCFCTVCAAILAYAVLARDYKTGYAAADQTVTFEYGTKKFKLTADGDLSKISIDGNTVSGTIRSNVSIDIKILLSSSLYSSDDFKKGSYYGPGGRWYYTYPEGADTIAMTIFDLSGGKVEDVHWTFTPGCYDPSTPGHDYTIVKNVDGIMRQYCVDTSGYGYNIQVSMAKNLDYTITSHIGF